MAEHEGNASETRGDDYVFKGWQKQKMVILSFRLTINIMSLQLNLE